ncbi:hypothetical protein HY949_03035 [Candidatus Gottesmanbacteria bacterium]|nr:hypothetical protein [Candidatus Gottesmanbacteria bacterium]
MKKLIQLVIGLLLLVAIPITIFVAGQNQEIRKKAAPATTMAITPSSLTKQAGDVFTVEVAIDTGENQVVAAELHLTYDSSKLEAQSITNGALFPNILASGTVEPGGAAITVGAADAKQPVRGTGTVATVKFLAKEKTDSPTAIKFTSNTFVGGLGEGASNVLVGTTPSMITITKDIAQSTPSPTPTLVPVMNPPDTLAPASSSGQTAQTPTPTPTSTPSASLSIVSPEENNEPTTNRPTIQGKAAPGSTVTVTVYSTPQTATVVADQNGNWNYTPQVPLESGPHNVVVSTTDQIGQTVTATTAFVVSTESGIGGATQSAIPVSGTVETTLLLLLVGGALVLFGFTLSHGSHGSHGPHGSHIIT